MSSLAKINGTHGIENWVWGTHGRKDLSHGADVLLHTSFVDGIVVGCKVAYSDLVREDL